MSEQLWTKFLDFFQGLDTIIVALLVAWLAIRKETKTQIRQRHFEFRDARAQMYADFIQKLNDTFAKYWDCLGLDDDPAHPKKKIAENAALKLDTSANTIKIFAPEFVSHACLNMNGHLQRMTTGLMFGVEVGPVDDEYESARRNVLAAMQRDIRLMDQTENRTNYEKSVVRENKKYFLEARKIDFTK